MLGVNCQMKPLCRENRNRSSFLTGEEIIEWERLVQHCVLPNWSALVGVCLTRGDFGVRDHGVCRPSSREGGYGRSVLYSPPNVGVNVV